MTTQQRFHDLVVGEEVERWGTPAHVVTDAAQADDADLVHLSGSAFAVAMGACERNFVTLPDRLSDYRGKPPLAVTRISSLPWVERGAFLAPWAGMPGFTARPQDFDAPVRKLPAWLGTLAVQDGILFGFLITMRVLVAFAAAGPARDSAARRVDATLLLLGAGVVVGRAFPGSPRVVRAAVYRICIAGTLLASYLMLGVVLPVVRTDSLDHVLANVDQRLFGVSPAIWMEAFATRAVVEYFSFFYLSYFALLIGFAVVVVWLERPSRHTAVFAIGTLLVFAIGQLGYVLVPGYGPYVHLSGNFAGPMDGGDLWRLMQRTVQAGGAMKDIFPSLHTAVPTWLMVYAAGRARTDPRWRAPALATGFFAANIVASTMFLRWHYAIDVIAGLSLATLAAAVAPPLARWEERRRHRFGHTQPWTFRRMSS